MQNNHADKPPSQHLSVVFVLYFIGIFLVGVANLLWPRNYLLFGISHVSFLPPAFQIIWMGMACAALIVIQRRTKTTITSAHFIAVALFMMASFFIFRTDFPTFQGDGNEGGCCYPEDMRSLKAYPGMHGRLQAFLAAGLSRIPPETFRLPFYHCGLHQSVFNNSVWILLTLLAGMAIVALVTRRSQKLDASPDLKWGLQGCLLFSAPLLNAYGLFDSYIHICIISFLSSDNRYIIW